MENVQIIYEDNDILAVNKPAGVVVHGDSPNLADWLIKNRPEIINVGEDKTRPGIVHRLDKDTSGVLLIAKNQNTFEHLKRQFQNRKIKKTYIALVDGDIKLPAGKTGIIELSIGKSKKDFRKKACVFGEQAEKLKLAGKIRAAVTEYKVIEKFKDYTLVNAFPKTGRTHQIRVHFSAIGHPIVCDKLYGLTKKGVCLNGLNRHFLHAVGIEFDTSDGKRMRIEADLPEYLKQVLSRLRKEQ